MVAAVILGGFYFISTLKSEFTFKIGGHEINVKQINYGWMTISVILLYMSSALSAVFWILSITAVITIAHAALHDVRALIDIILSFTFLLYRLRSKMNLIPFNTK